MQYRRYLFFFLGLIVSIVLTVWILSRFRISDVGQALRAGNYYYLLPVAGLILLSFSIRALRWGRLFSVTPKWGNLFQSMMTGYLINNLLPAHAGEVVRAYFLSQREGLSKSTVFATVMVERAADLVVILVLLGTILFSFPLPPWTGPAGFIVILAGFFAISFLILFTLVGGRVVKGMIAILGFLPNRFLIRIETMSKNFLTGASGLRNLVRGSQFLGCTALIWLTELGITFLIARAFYLPVSVWGTLFVMLVVGLGLMVPSSPGYMGTYEFFATGALDLLGVKGGEALSFALVLHGATFLGSNLLGMICFLQAGFRLGGIFPLLAAKK